MSDAFTLARNPLDLTEDGAALVFAHRYSERARYCHTTGRWFIWDGAIWRVDGTEQAKDLARQMVREIADEAQKPESASCRKRNFVENVVALARADQRIARTGNDWNRDAYLLGTPAGTVDLRTGRLRAADPADHITLSVAVAPGDVDDCPRFKRFLSETFGSDETIVGFIQGFFGYCLTGDTCEHALLFGVGGGGNGKSVLLNTVSGVMGDYARQAAMDTFTASYGDRHPTDLAMLKDARLVTASETEEGRAWAESRIKAITGGDPIQARFMRQDFFTYRPAFKLFIVGNHKPTLTNIDEALRRRFNIVPFDHRPALPDPGLETRLRDEWPGILRWFIDGALAWQNGGLTKPEIIRAATDGYFADQDVFGQWLADECDVEPNNRHKWETPADLFACWRVYAERANERPGTAKAFADHMRRHGFEPARGSKGARRWLGVQLIRHPKRTGNV